MARDHPKHVRRTAPRQPWTARLGTTWRRAAGAFGAPQVSSAARERRDTLVLLAAVALVALPHFEHLAPWATVTLVALWLWRLALTLMRRTLPGRALMLPLLLGASAAVWLQHGTLLGRDAGVTFLLLLMGLKLLEMRAKRDVFVVVFLAFFILLTQFLYGQGLLIAAIALGAVIALFFVLLSVQLLDGDLSAQRKLAMVGGLLLKALPLTAVLFLLFPRLSGPLWGLPGDRTASTTGLSNSMSPGSISRLLESDEIALRARFTGTPPAREVLYWRGPVFGAFNGRSWSPLPRTQEGPAPAITASYDPDSVTDYTVTLEPSQRDWLFALELAMLPVPLGDTPLRVRYGAEMQLLADRPIEERIRYQVRSYTRYAAGADSTQPALQNWLQLPPGFNPRTLQFATDLKHQVVPESAGTPHANDAQLVDAVIDHFRRGGYRYTLTPPLLGRDGVDEFLFETRQGYCEHYAAAFVVLMRALDLPARVVTGYQGGEISPVDGYMTVRQSDAHAWAEVWLAGRGWFRVDPTAVVAPIRIDRGAEEIARQSGLLPLSRRIAPLAWMRSLRLNWEALDNAWNQWVLSYSPQRQRALLSLLGLAPDASTLAWAFAIGVSTLLGALALLSLRHRAPRDPLAAATALLHRRLLAAGASVTPSDGPRAAVARLRSQLSPLSQAEAEALFGWLEQARYAPTAGATTTAQLRTMRRRIARFRPSLRDA